MKKILLTTSTVLLFSIMVSNASTIDICDRGRIGELIAEQVRYRPFKYKILSPSCASVDKEKMSRLLYLNLSGREIKDIPENAFAGLDSLEWLWLDNNQITSIEKNDFLGLSSLLILDLYDNQITSIEENSFAQLGFIERLGYFLQYRYGRSRSHKIKNHI